MFLIAPFHLHLAHSQVFRSSFPPSINTWNWTRSCLIQIWTITFPFPSRNSERILASLSKPKRVGCMHFNQSPTGLVIGRWHELITSAQHLHSGVVLSRMKFGLPRLYILSSANASSLQFLTFSLNRRLGVVCVRCSYGTVDWIEFYFSMLHRHVSPHLANLMQGILRRLVCLAFFWIYLCSCSPRGVHLPDTDLNRRIHLDLYYCTYKSLFLTSQWSTTTSPPSFQTLEETALTKSLQSQRWYSFKVLLNYVSFFRELALLPQPLKSILDKHHQQIHILL